MQRSRWLLGLLALVVMALGMSGDCESVDCERTTTEAETANKVDLTVGRSSTLAATLRAGDGTGLSGKPLRFAVLDDGAEVYHAEGSTGSDGVARVDLKRVDVGALQGLARADEFRASFAGDTTYCSSSDDADFRVVAGIGVSG